MARRAGIAHPSAPARLSTTTTIKNVAGSPGANSQPHSDHSNQRETESWRASEGHSECPATRFRDSQSSTVRGTPLRARLHCPDSAVRPLSCRSPRPSSRGESATHLQGHHLVGGAARASAAFSRTFSYCLHDAGNCLRQASPVARFGL